MSEDVKISVTIITFNEEENIADCIASVQWADEVLVVDSESVDATVERAEAAGCRIIRQPFLGYVKQKEFAVRAAAHDWVLCLDADERMEPGAEKEIRSLLATEQGRLPAGYFFPRHTYYLAGWVNHGGWWPEYRLRLFDRTRGEWTGTDPHDRLEVRGETGRLRSEIIHFNYRDITHHMEKVNHYTSIMSQRKEEAGQKPCMGRMLFNPMGKFLRMYLLRRGFLDGKRGFVIAAISSFYVFLKYAKLWERGLPRNRPGHGDKP